MEQYIIECKFEFFSSHSINEVGFQGASVYNLEEGVSCCCPLGFSNTTIALSCTNSPDFNVKIESLDLKEESDQVLYLNCLASYLSFVASKSVIDGYYGTPFIKVHFDTFRTNTIFVENKSYTESSVSLKSLVKITDNLSIASFNRVKFNNSNIINIHYSEVLDYYYNGLRAESEKSKFFHWFLIVEYLEGSDLYSRTFPSGTMFTEDENNSIRELASNFSNDKKNALLSVLTRTSEFRNQKLFKLLSELDIRELPHIKGILPITLDTVKSVTTARNKLFHRGNEFPQDILWFALFPLVRLIIEKITQEPKCLD
ncbi:hypothetical protein [Moellerella wisconsensis]|uniref:hypothetical protein n=1 Tax=Moellerella wisconsensis TaxID=158849 RepID=UPI0024107B9C|nr:hypothetical protein [Moellerella wisconsensis]